MRHYGKHLSLLLSNIEFSELLEDEELIANYLREVVERIDMTILGGPLTSYENTKDTHKIGISGLIILCESHIAIHTYPKIQKVFLDVFSCKDFSVDVILNVTSEYFGFFEIMEKSVFDRGRHWQNNIHLEHKKWNKKRN